MSSRADLVPLAGKSVTGDGFHVLLLLCMWCMIHKRYNKNKGDPPHLEDTERRA